MQSSFSSTVAQIQQKVPTAEIFQAMLMDLSVAANCVYQSPMHMPEQKVTSAKGFAATTVGRAKW